MKRVAVINGPNLNLLGAREKNIYGDKPLTTINSNLEQTAKHLNFSIDFMQSNLEGELVNYIQALIGKCDFLIINAGGYTHTSVAIRDALLSVAIPFIEVHLSNVDKREEFRKISFLSDIASGVIYGFGALSYELALIAAAKLLASS